MARALRLIAAFSFLLLLWSGCKGGEYDVELTFGASVLDPSNNVRLVEVLIVSACPDASVVSSGALPSDVLVRDSFRRGESASFSGAGSLDPGEYGLYALGFDADCAVIAAGCAPIRLREGGGGVLEVTLESTPPVSACPSASCVDGECIMPDGGMDGGVDASVPGDACADYPCPANQYCTDLADPAPVSEAGRTCRMLTSCGTGQYQNVPPTATTDRICNACADSCGAGSFESVSCADGNSPQNRACSPLTVCATGQYQTTAPTATSDRVCGTCPPACTGGEYESSPCADGNGTSNRVCAPCHSSCTFCDGPSSSDCTQCPPDQYFDTGSCRPLTTCVGGQYQSIPPTATSDRMCSACAVCTLSTQFEITACANGNSPQDRTCRALTACGSGEYQSTAPTVSSDRVCSTCATCTASQYEVTACANGNAPQNRACAQLTMCASGQYQSTPPTSTSDRGCSACATCTASQYESTACANGNTPQNRVCTSLTNCTTGQYESAPPTPTANRTCSMCAPGCGQGLYESTPCANGNVLQNRVCSPCHATCVNCSGPGAGDCVSCGPGQFNPGTGCIAVTNCTAGQYEQSPPTATTDRVCGTCAAACNVNEYESAACANGDAPQNRVCTSLTNCGVDQYQSTAPTATANRVCSTCTACTGSQYESTACANGNTSQNRVCAALTNCTAGQYQSTAPTATSDRVCSACTACTGSQYESTSCANGSTPQDRVCTALTSCTAGQYQSMAPTATSNRVCSSCAPACGSGQYESTACANGNTSQNRTCSACHASCTNCSGPLASECTGCGPTEYFSGGTCLPLTNCTAGQYQSAAPTATTDRACSTCAVCSPSTQYEIAACANGNAPQNRVCTALTNCPMGQYQSTPPTPSSDRVCSACATCTGSQYESTACANGNAPQNRVCTALTNCSADQYQSTAPTVSSDRICSACATCTGSQYESTACANGNTPQNRVCTALTSCTTGQYQSIPPTSTTNRVCSSCAPACGSGQYESTACANGNTSQNRICSACHPSCTNCSGPLASECTGCGPTEYFSGGNCLPLTNCAAGQYQSVAPTATTNRVCSACAPTCGAGQYESTACANGNTPQNRLCTALTSCGAGQYQSTAPTTTSDRVCSACTACTGSQYESTACANGNTSQNRVCTSLTNCMTGQYQSMAPTATSDRVCTACATCTASQYESTACANGNAPQNRMCTALTNCTTGQYQSMPPTATSNRVCTSCVPACGAGQYESTACANGNTSQNRVCSACHASCTNCTGPLSTDCISCGPTQYFSGGSCMPLTNCTTGQYESTAPTPTSNRACSACATCTGSQYESTACANGNTPQNRVCMAVTNCTTGQYQSMAPTATSNRVCNACATCTGSQYESTACANGNTSQNRVCTSLTTCTTGQYQSVAPTATSDRMCGTCATCTGSQYESTACADGNAPQNRVCMALTNCTTGQYQSMAPTATSNRVCSSCAPACSTGQYESTACANGNTSQNRVCTACTPVTQCAAGLSCTSPTSSQCTSCNAGFTLVNNTPPTADMCVPAACTLIYNLTPTYRIEGTGANRTAAIPTGRVVLRMTANGSGAATSGPAELLNVWFDSFIQQMYTECVLIFCSSHDITTNLNQFAATCNGTVNPSAMTPPATCNYSDTTTTGATGTFSGTQIAWGACPRHANYSGDGYTPANAVATSIGPGCIQSFRSVGGLDCGGDSCSSYGLPGGTSYEDVTFPQPLEPINFSNGVNNISMGYIYIPNSRTGRVSIQFTGVRAGGTCM